MFRIEPSRGQQEVCWQASVWHKLKHKFQHFRWVSNQPSLLSSHRFWHKYSSSSQQHFPEWMKRVKTRQKLQLLLWISVIKNLYSYYTHTYNSRSTHTHPSSFVRFRWGAGRLAEIRAKSLPSTVEVGTTCIHTHSIYGLSSGKLWGCAKFIVPEKWYTLEYVSSHQVHMVTLPQGSSLTWAAYHKTHTSRKALFCPSESGFECFVSFSLLRINHIATVCWIWYFNSVEHMHIGLVGFCTPRTWEWLLNL